MSFTKYTKTDGTAQVLSREAHKKAEEALRKQGKTSADELSDKEREEFTTELHQTE